ncbi:MAG: glycosyltransferase family 4 protein [Candidatus Bipolaricaulota bacterium]|nr:glycosyltransferase family 4 protein [Candidatus Bipolaricaulota bacterium]
MRVCLYLEAESVIGRSGFRTAFLQQLRALQQQDLQVTTDPNDDYDILHLHWFGPLSFYNLIKAKQQGKKVIAHAHSVGAYDLKDSFTLSNTLAPLYERYLQYFYEQSDAIFTPSEHAQKLLEAQGIRTPIYVISNGVDLERFRFDPHKRAESRAQLGLKRFTVFCAGNVIPRKGIIDFIEVARRLKKFDFVWFGHLWGKFLAYDSEMNDALESRPKNVRMPGFVEDTPAAYAAGDLLLYLSYGETHGLVLLEAAALERPIVLRDLPEYQSLGFTDGVNCLKGKTVEEFCDRVERLAGDAPLQKRLGGAARALAEAHALDRVGQRLHELYQKILDGKEGKLR